MKDNKTLYKIAKAIYRKLLKIIYRPTVKAEKNIPEKGAIKRLSKYIPEDVPAGKILGKVTLVDCVKMSPEFKEMLLKENKDIYTDSSFKENYGWQLENVEVFDEPIEAKGKLSLWEYDLKEK